MYVRPDGRRQPKRDIFIPDNYSGNAFNDTPELEPTPEPEVTEEVSEPKTREAAAKPSSFIDGISGEDLLLLGVILLLSKEEGAGEILPILLMLLFFR